MLMAWSEPSQLTERFRTVGMLLRQACKHWSIGSSYDGWVAAQKREAPRLVPLIVQRLRRQMEALKDYQRCGGWEAFAVDGSQIACPRTLENQQAMGDLGKPNGIPQMSLTGMLHLGTGLPWDFRVGPGTDSERSHLRDMLGDLPARSLLVADAGFVGYDLCRDLIQRKQHFLLRVGGNIHLLESLGYNYEIAGRTVYLWPAHKQNKNEPPIRLRLIVLRDEGKQPVYLVTDVVDPVELSDEAGGTIYLARWGIEVQYRTTKQTMQHHTMRSRTPQTCYQEMTWAFLGVWLLQLMTARKIVAAGGDPRRLSTAKARNSVRRVMRHQPAGAQRRHTLCHVLANCRVDNYVRHGPKASRNYPHKKRHKPPDPPKIKLPGPTQVRKAQQLTPLNMPP
jgi:hypothetical protein